jgi:hypothetical protein
VTGTAGMTVDFGAQSLSGTLALTGSRDATSVDYGTFGFSGKIFSYGSTSASEIRRGSGSAIGSMLVNFYGPAAEEAAGIYRLRVPDGAGAGTLVTGAMVAKAK